MSGRQPQRPAGSFHFEEPSTSAYGRPGLISPDQDPDSYSTTVTAGSDAVKHRRSRSGCYTCRGRRVKCDESRPICERCRKGKRECIYSEPQRPGRANTKSKAIPEEAVSTAEDQDAVGVDEQSPTQIVLRREESDTPSLTHSKSLSPSTQGSTPYFYSRDVSDQLSPKGHARSSDGSSSSRDPSVSMSPPALTGSPSAETPRPQHVVAKNRSDLSSAVRFYLDYQRQHMSFYHYGLTLDARGFCHQYLVNQALTNDALLYSVVAFAAYHHSVRRPDGRIQEFLGYYSKSLTLLRLSLQRNQKRTAADLLTMLQLAVLEEHLGDWVTLMAHQRAAYSILTTLYTPQTILQDDMANKILEWYMRFDLFAGFISGSEGLLHREWFEVQHKYYQRLMRDNPNDLAYKWDERNACERVLAKDISILFHNRSRATIDERQFNDHANALNRRFTSWYRDIPPAILDPAKVLKDLPKELSLAVDSEEEWSEVIIYGEDLWPTNHMFVHFWTVELMFNQQLAMVQRRPPPPDIASLAFKICQMFEAVELRDPEPGAVLGVHAASGMASVFLRKEPQLTMWCRRKQALIESKGYVYPSAFREKMSNAWGVDVRHWWLPEEEGFTPVLKQIREFVQWRQTPPKDRASEELREMSGIFESFKSLRVDGS